MAHLYRDLSVQSLYADLKAGYTLKQWQDKIERSTTLYIGNLDTETTDYQLHALFGRVGEVKRIIMGKDRNDKETPCGFCFVEYVRRADTEDAIRFFNGMKVDEHIIRVDWDGGFEEGRQYGRGRSGGQVRWDYYPRENGANHIEPVQALGRRKSSSALPPLAPLEHKNAGPPGGHERGPDSGSKRSKQEANPRFRSGFRSEDRGDDDDD
jgi:nuclear cap-binding protein subunit 2